MIKQERMTYKVTVFEDGTPIEDRFQIYNEEVTFTHWVYSYLKARGCKKVKSYISNEPYTIVVSFFNGYADAEKLREELIDIFTTLGYSFEYSTKETKENKKEDNE